MSKNDLYSKKKKVASSTLSSIMLKYYKRKLLVYMSHYRNQVHKIRVTESKKRVAISHWVTKDLRLAFNRWKH